MQCGDYCMCLKATDSAFVVWCKGPISEQLGPAQEFFRQGCVVSAAQAVQPEPTLVLFLGSQPAHPQLPLMIAIVI